VSSLWRLARLTDSVSELQLDDTKLTLGAMSVNSYVAAVLADFIRRELLAAASGKRMDTGNGAFAARSQSPRAKSRTKFLLPLGDSSFAWGRQTQSPPGIRQRFARCYQLLAWRTCSSRTNSAKAAAGRRN
jgi:hypothetical protein